MFYATCLLCIDIARRGAPRGTGLLYSAPQQLQIAVKLGFDVTLYIRATLRELLPRPVPWPVAASGGPPLLDRVSWPFTKRAPGERDQRHDREILGAPRHVLEAEVEAPLLARD